jgi:hypothetical protein
LSHIVTIKTEVRDANAVRSGCRRLRLPHPVQSTHRLFSGELRYDNYGGRWGDQKHLDAFLQAYAVEKAKIEARRKGHSVSESQLTDGSVKLTINVG